MKTSLRMERQIALALALLLCGPFSASAKEGTATFFPNVAIAGPCNDRGRLQGPEPPTQPVYAAKAGGALWADGAACGHKYCVVCVGAANTSQTSPCRGKSYAAVSIQAPCPDCGDATISISKPGFEAIADSYAADAIKIQYARIDNANLPCA